MIPIECVAVVLWFAFGLVGLARRFPVEMGATIGFVAMLLMFNIVDSYLGAATTAGLGALGVDGDPNLALWALYTAGIVLWCYFMYVGQTLRFGGVWPPGRIIGWAMDFMAGLLNGWLVIGTWWHYTDLLGYPMQKWGAFVPPLSSRATSLLGLTPQALLPDPYATIVLAGLLIVLIGLRVIR